MRKASRFFLFAVLVALNVSIIENHEEDGESATSPTCAPGQKYKIQYPGACEKFYVCKDGHLGVESCPMFKKFDNISASCRYSMLVNCTSIQSMNINETESLSKMSCISGQNYKVQYPGDCEKFYVCENGNLTVETCSLFKRFDPNTSSCRYFVFVNCSSDAPPELSILEPEIGVVNDSTTIIPSKPQEVITVCNQYKKCTAISCTSGDKFKTVYPGDCKKFYLCHDGSLTIESCPWYELFDPITRSCIYTPYSDCSSLESSDVKQIVTTETSATSVPNSGALSKICRRGQKFHLPYPGECKKYYTCDDGNLIERSCNFLRYFDVRTRSCVFLFVDCSLSEKWWKNEIFGAYSTFPFQLPTLQNIHQQ